MTTTITQKETIVTVTSHSRIKDMTPARADSGLSESSLTTSSERTPPTSKVDPKKPHSPVNPHIIINTAGPKGMIYSGKSSSLGSDKNGRKESNTSSFPRSAHELHGARRFVRIKLPADCLHTMQEDDRFDGVCHAWVRRPDFCRFGINCDFVHEYPPELAKEYGMIVVYVGVDGREIKGVEEDIATDDEVFLKPQAQWTKLEEGAKLHSPGCFKEDCRAYVRDTCAHGDRCWYKHPRKVLENGRWVERDTRELGGRRRSPEEIERERVRANDALLRNKRNGAFTYNDSRSRISSRPTQLPAAERGSRIAAAAQPQVINSHATAALPRNDRIDAAAAAWKNATDEFIKTEKSSAHVIAKKVSVNPIMPNVAPPANFAATKPHVGTVTPVFPDIRPAFLSTWFSDCLIDFGEPVTKIIPASTSPYNNWGSDGVKPDEADCWANQTPPTKPTLEASREQARVVEAMTYEDCFRNVSTASRQAPRTSVVWEMPPEPNSRRGRVGVGKGWGVEGFREAGRHALEKVKKIEIGKGKGEIKLKDGEEIRGRRSLILGSVVGIAVAGEIEWEEELFMAERYTKEERKKTIENPDSSETEETRIAKKAILWELIDLSG